MNNEERIKIIEHAVEDFGSLVHEYRVRNFMTMGELAFEVGCSPSFILRIEHHLRFPSLDFKLRFFEKAMEFSQDEIYQFLLKYMEKEKMKKEIS